MPELSLELTIEQQFEVQKFQQILSGLKPTSKNMNDLSGMTISLIQQNFMLKNSIKSLIIGGTQK